MPEETMKKYLKVIDTIITCLLATIVGLLCMDEYFQLKTVSPIILWPTLFFLGGFQVLFQYFGNLRMHISLGIWAPEGSYFSFGRVIGAIFGVILIVFSYVIYVTELFK